MLGLSFGSFPEQLWHLVCGGWISGVRYFRQRLLWRGMRCGGNLRFLQWKQEKSWNFVDSVVTAKSLTLVSAAEFTRPQSLHDKDSCRNCFERIRLIRNILRNNRFRMQRIAVNHTTWSDEENSITSILCPFQRYCTAHRFMKTSGLTPWYNMAKYMQEQKPFQVFLEKYGLPRTGCVQPAGMPARSIHSILRKSYSITIVQKIIILRRKYVISQFAEFLKVIIVVRESEYFKKSTEFENVNAPTRTRC